MKSRLSYIALPALESTPDWCEKNIYLSPRIPTSEPGQWSRKNVAAICCPGGPIEALDNPEIETVVIEKGSQTCLTTSAYAWLAHCQAVEPSSALIVMNSTQDARDKSMESWRPMWEDSPAMQRFMPRNRRREWTKLYQVCNAGPVYWIGANSPGRLGSKPIRRLILDEVDKYPQQSKREAGAAALARQRVKAFKKKAMAKVLEFSTPTDDTGEVHQEFLNGDQRELYVRCPRCKAEQVMRWASFKIDMTLSKTDPNKAITEAHYECPHCRGAWSDYDRWSAIETGEWRATCKASDPRCWSGRLPSWCSSFVTTAYLAAQWVRAQASSSALQDFINAECGEPFVHYENGIRDKAFAELEGQYKEGEMWANLEPYKTQYGEFDRWVLAGVDVQKGYLVAAFRQFVSGGDSGLIWAGDVANFETLDKLAAQYDAKFLLVDSRYRTHEVNEWAANHAGYIPAQGVSRKGKALFTVQEFDVDEGRRGHSQGRNIETISFDHDLISDMLADLIQRKPDAKRWLIPAGYAMHRAYTDQMTAQKSINGKWLAIPASKPDHFWDAEKLALLAAIRFQVWRSQDEQIQTHHATAGA